MKKMLFGIWTVIMIVGAGLSIWSMTKDRTYTGTDVTFSVSNGYIVVDAAEVTMEVADDQFFVLREESGETVVGESQPKPLGWQSDAYFKAEAREVPGGKWIVEKATGATVHLTSDDAIAVKFVLTQSEKVSSFFLMAIVFFVIWIFSLLFLI